MQNNVGIYASQISGHLWAPNGSMDALATVTVPSGGAASVEFAGIPQGYKHLKICAITRSTTGGTGSGGTKIQFNGDTNFANYTYHRLIGDGSSPNAYGQAGGDYPFILPLDGNTAGAYAAGIIDILDYSSITKNKTMKVLDGADYNGSGVVGFKSQLWMNSSSAILSIVLTPSTGNFKQYSQFALYGVK